jgi:zinc transport system substrate-binding protein
MTLSVSRRLLLSLLVLFLVVLFLMVKAYTLCGVQAFAQQTPSMDIRVVASIRPLALIAEDLLGELGTVDILVPSAASPHDYALKVSDVRKLQSADLAVWMGPELERFLQKPLAGLAPQRVLALGQSEAGESPLAHDHDKDLHQWLDPRLAQAMARAIAERLQDLFPAHRAALERRLRTQLAGYDRLHHDLGQALAPVSDISFVVQHRGYDYFVRAYGLNQLAWISLSPEQPPGVRHLYELEKTLRALPPGQEARCLFVELSHRSATAENLADQLGLTLQTLDILGVTAATYPALMRQLTQDAVNCLAGKPGGGQLPGR